ncbi:cupin domain-containing protein [Streptomyces sp. NPDC058653]|uniref:cupin domain-containing protein n=1 Tax=Streptomyces sp. NPDC058653 TaxID=3346576 RepID=UPI003669B9C8
MTDPQGPVIPLSTVVPEEIAVAALPDDDRIWVPQAPDVWFRPLLFNTVTGQWCNLLKVTAAGIVSRHRHPGADPVVGIAARRPRQVQPDLTRWRTPAPPCSPWESPCSNSTPRPKERWRPPPPSTPASAATPPTWR